MNRARRLRTASGLGIAWLISCTPAPREPQGVADASNSAGTVDVPSTEASSSPPVPVSDKTGSLPQLEQGLSRDQCDDGPGNEGATSYFTAQVSRNGDGFRGQERWLLFANEKWKARGGKDCVVVWALEGELTTPGACSRCDMGMELKAQLDEQGSTCPEKLWEREEQATLSYALELRDDGTSTWFFQESGRVLGEGYHTGRDFNYISEASCRWF